VKENIRTGESGGNSGGEWEGSRMAIITIIVAT